MTRHVPFLLSVLFLLLAPFARAGWLFDPVASTISDGNWVLKVRAEGTELSVQKPLSVADGSALDLRSPVADAGGTPYQIVSLSGFQGRNALVSVTLPDTLRSFGPKVFTDCANLESVVPLVPASVEKLSPWTFVRCRKLRGEPRLLRPGTEVVDATPDANGSQFYECHLITAADLSGVADIGRFAFYKCYALTNVVFSKDLVRIRNNVFQECRSLADLVFPGPSPVVDANVFQGCPSGKIRAHLLGGSQGWAKPRSGTTASPTDDDLARYRGLFPGATEPSYVWTINNVKIWLVEPPATDFLEIEGTPDYVGVVTPPYGRGNFAPGTSIECSAPANALQDGLYYASVASVYDEELAAGAWSAPVTNASRSATIVKKAGTVQRLTWLWERRGRIGIPEAARAVVSLSPASPLGNDEYPVGTEVTLSVTPPEGRRFWRWRGDVPEAQAHETTVTVRAETLLSIEPLFSTDWTYDGTAKPKTMTDGNWTLAVVERKDGTLEVDKVLAVTTPTFLDLAAPIHDAEGADRVLASVGDYAFRSLSSIEYLRFPETLVSIGREAFWNCDGLKRIEPFLPDSVSYVGGWAFALCSRCESPLRLVNGSVVLDERSQNGRGSHFYKMRRLPSADLSGVKRLSIDLFYQCDALRDVTLAEDLVEIGEQAFYECKALETVTPFLPDSLEKMGRWAFVRCPRLGPELRLVSPGLGVIRDSTFFDAPKIRNAILTGPTNIEYQAFKFCSGLTNVVLSPRLVSLGLGGDERGETFAECTSLRTVSPFLPKTLEQIRIKTFDNCKALSGDLDFSSPAMTRPPKQVFRYCDNLRSITFAKAAVDFTDAYGILFNSAKGQKLYFPGKAPVNLTGTFLFSSPGGADLPKTFYGSLRLDPDGWRAISRELTDEDRARPDFPGPGTFGVLTESDPATSRHWCVDWRSPLERQASTVLMLR